MTLNTQWRNGNALSASVPRVLESPPLVVGTARLWESGRERIEQYIAEIFRLAHGARVMSYMPLLVYREEEGALQAALGLRGAASSRLFCERYLEDPIETHVARQFGRVVNRSQIMELGNLVASSAGQSVALYLLVVAALHEAGIDYLVFAANRAVRFSIRRCGFETRDLGPADPAALGAAASDWGSYYEGSPRVILGDLRQAVEHGRRQACIAELWSRERIRIEALADSIRSLRAG